MRRQQDPFEEIAQQGLKKQQQQEDDIVKWTVEDAKGNRKDVYSVERDVKFRGEDGLPMIVAQRTFMLDDTGKSFGNIKNVGKCKHGCWVRTLFPCRHCRQMVCQRHALVTGNRVYCRDWPCWIFGRMRQAHGILHRVFRLCFGPMMVKKPERVVASERDFFAKTEEREDLNVMERGPDEDER